VVWPLLGSWLHGVVSGRLMLLDYTGGRTGRRYTFPVGYFRWDDGDVLAFSTRAVARSDPRRPGDPAAHPRPLARCRARGDQ
jgi:hypothetical protein